MSICTTQSQCSHAVPGQTSSNHAITEYSHWSGVGYRASAIVSVVHVQSYMRLPRFRKHKVCFEWLVEALIHRQSINEPSLVVTFIKILPYAKLLYTVRLNVSIRCNGSGIPEIFINFLYLFTEMGWAYILQSTLLRYHSLIHSVVHST